MGNLRSTIGLSLSFLLVRVISFSLLLVRLRARGEHSVFSMSDLDSSLTLTVGAAIGVNAALISIITAWLSDLKLGHCSAGWWLNQKFCCMEIERGGVVGSGGGEEGCLDWIIWSNWTGLRWLFYILYAVRVSVSELSSAIPSDVVLSARDSSCSQAQQVI